MKLAAVPAEPPSEQIRRDDRRCAGSELGRGVHTLELQQLIRVLIVEFAEHLLQHNMSAADVDDDSMGSRLSARKATRMTNVAPWSFWAGPKLRREKSVRP
jgi:hypothetical protein